MSRASAARVPAGSPHARLASSQQTDLMLSLDFEAAYLADL